MVLGGVRRWVDAGVELGGAGRRWVSLGWSWEALGKSWVALGAGWLREALGGAGVVPGAIAWRIVSFGELNSALVLVSQCGSCR